MWASWKEKESDDWFLMSSWEMKFCVKGRGAHQHLNQSLFDAWVSFILLGLEMKRDSCIKSQHQRLISWKDECYQDQALDVYCQKKRSKRLVLTLVFFSLRNRTSLVIHFPSFHRWITSKRSICLFFILFFILCVFCSFFQWKNDTKISTRIKWKDNWVPVTRICS